MKIKSKLKMFWAVAGSTALLFSQAAADIIVTADSNVETNTQFFENVFSGTNVYGRRGTIQTWGLDNWFGTAMATANSSSSGATITAAAISGIDWLVVSGGPTPDATEMSLIDSFLAGGGNLYLGGEADNPYAAHTTANAVLAHIGSPVFLDDTANFFDDGTAVSASPYTAGAPNWVGAYAGNIVNGTPLYQSAEGTTLVALASTSPIPEPSNVLCVLGALGGAFFLRKRK